MFPWNRKKLSCILNKERKTKVRLNKRCQCDEHRGQWPKAHVCAAVATHQALHARGSLQKLVPAPGSGLHQWCPRDSQKLWVGQILLWFQRLKLWFSFRTRTSLSDLQRITAETPTAVPWITVILMVLTPTTCSPLTQWQLSYTTNYGIFRASGSLFWIISMSSTED